MHSEPTGSPIPLWTRSGYPLCMESSTLHGKAFNINCRCRRSVRITEPRENVNGGQVSGSDEGKSERIDRELIELLNELRVALPGVQVLFAFLLAVPFAQGWTHTTTFQRDLYFGTLLATALSSALLIAPSAYHRINFRLRDKERL